jgi:hypothetical protein
LQYVDTYNQLIAKLTLSYLPLADQHASCLCPSYLLIPLVKSDLLLSQAALHWLLASGKCCLSKQYARLLLAAYAGRLGN